MFIETARSAALSVLAALAAACAATVPPTSPADLAQVSPGFVVGYLNAAELPDSLALLPPPPAASSAAQAADEDAYRSTRKLRDTPRWALAAKDADLDFPQAAETFSCALALPISQQATPNLNMLIRRVRADASWAVEKAKNVYKRRRPFAVHGDGNCTPRRQFKDDSYPSSHASVGWAWALVLAEIAPDRAKDILARGLAFGQSRVVCGVHWKSDVEAGLLVGAAVVSRLHVDPLFAAQLSAAREEIERSHATGVRPTLDCKAQSRALEIKP